MIGPGDIVTASLFGMMAAMGMGLRPNDFLAVLRRPSAFLLGAVGQLAVLPAVAFALAWAVDLAPAPAIGLVLIAACPGGATSNAFSQYARGDVALSVSLTALSSSLSFLTVPLVVGLAIRTFGGASAQLSLSFAETATRLFTMTALPVAVGMATLHLWPRSAVKLRGPLLGVSTGIVVTMVFVLGVSIGGTDMLRLLLDVGPVVLALMVCMAAVALSAGRWLGLPGTQRRTVLIELAVQNFNLALVVALTFLDDEELLGPALVYLPVMLLFASAVVVRAHRARPRGIAEP